jgi:large subunit ribosomal protein L31e
MAKKEEAKLLERTYTIPLRREYSKVPGWRRTKKAVKACKEFLQKHMKSQDVKLSTTLNEKIWNHGGKNPPHHVKVTVTKDQEGVVKAELFGVKKKVEKTSKKTPKAVPKEAPVVEEPKSEEKKEVSEEVEKEVPAPEPKAPEEKVQHTDKVEAKPQDQY